MKSLKRLFAVSGQEDEMEDLANQNQRYVCAPLLDNWAVYDKYGNTSEAIICLTLNEAQARFVTERLNLSELIP